MVKGQKGRQGNGREMQGMEKNGRNNKMGVFQDNRFRNKGKFPWIFCE